MEFRGTLDDDRCAAVAAALPDGMHPTVDADGDATTVEMHVYAQRWITAQEIASRAARQALSATGVGRLDVRRVEVIEEDRLG